MLKKSKMLQHAAMFAMLSVIMIGLFANPLQSQAQTNSAPISPTSVTRADDGLIKACAEAVEELKAARKLIAAQKGQVEAQERLLTIQTEIEEKLKKIGDLSEREKEELRKALAAKDREIAALEKAVAELKKRKISIWTVVKLGAVFTAGGIVIGKVLNKFAARG